MSLSITSTTAGYGSPMVLIVIFNGGNLIKLCDAIDFFTSIGRHINVAPEFIDINMSGEANFKRIKFIKFSHKNHKNNSDNFNSLIVRPSKKSFELHGYDRFIASVSQDSTFDKENLDRYVFVLLERKIIDKLNDIKKEIFDISSNKSKIHFGFMRLISDDEDPVGYIRGFSPIHDDVFHHVQTEFMLSIKKGVLKDHIIDVLPFSYLTDIHLDRKINGSTFGDFLHGNPLCRIQKIGQDLWEWQVDPKNDLWIAGAPKALRTELRRQLLAADILISKKHTSLN